VFGVWVGDDLILIPGNGHSRGVPVKSKKTVIEESNARMSEETERLRPYRQTIQDILLQVVADRGHQDAMRILLLMRKAAQNPTDQTTLFIADFAAAVESIVIQVELKMFGEFLNAAAE
jgi:hypothetical protein